MKHKNIIYSIRTKLIVGFGAVIALVLISSFYLYQKAIEMTRQITYEKMSAQADFYLQMLDNEISHIRQLQFDFFLDRKLPFLVGPEILIDDYDKREALLSVKERIATITGVSNLIEGGILYLPKSEYRITATQVGRMYDSDYEVVSQLQRLLDGKVHFEDGTFVMVEAGVSGMRAESVPNYLLVITLSVQQLRENLKALNFSEYGGTFLFHEEAGIISSDQTHNCVEEEILLRLYMDHEQEYLQMQKVSVDGSNYLVFVGGQGEMGLFVEYIQEDYVMEHVNRFRIIVFFVFVLTMAASVFYAFYSHRLIHQPMDILQKAFNRIQSGNWKEHILHNRKDEFGYIYNSFNAMEDQMEQMIERVYVQTNLAQRAQMKQLQAQIAPHFLYNSFFSLSRKIKREDYENAEALARHLGAYFQYLTRNESDFVTLEKETEHAKSYIAIQQARFTNRIRIEFESVPEGFRFVKFPRLTLQPLLENAFEHGLEKKIANSILTITFHKTNDELQIRIEDNGELAQEVLEKLKNGLKKGDYEETTAIYNIHKRLQILYSEQAGLRTERSRMGGLCVTVFVNLEVANASEFIDY